MAASRGPFRFASRSGVRALAVCAVLALLLGACSGSSAGEVAEPATAAPVETPAAVETPTEAAQVEPTVETLTNEERIAAALAEFEANPQPQDLFAYDILDTTLSGKGVIISLCAWTGETVFDEVRQATYRVSTEPNQAGEPDVTFESATLATGDCLNTTLIESALQATRDYDNYWRGVTDDPTTFDQTEASDFMIGALVEQTAIQVREWTDAGLSVKSTERDGLLPSSSITEVLGRRWEEAGVSALELISCRDLPADYGLYKEDLLVDNGKDEAAVGTHATTRYGMIRQSGKWKIFGADGLAWADCLAFEDGWLAGINRTLPDPTAWHPWTS